LFDPQAKGLGECCDPAAWNPGEVVVRQLACPIRAAAAAVARRDRRCPDDDAAFWPHVPPPEFTAAAPP
jgi:hypothetical protein